MTFKVLITTCAPVTGTYGVSQNSISSLVVEFNTMSAALEARNQVNLQTSHLFVMLAVPLFKVTTESK